LLIKKSYKKILHFYTAQNEILKVMYTFVNVIIIQYYHKIYRFVRISQQVNAIYRLNLGCLHPVAPVISYDVGFNPSTQRHYRTLIYYLYIHSYMFRSFDHHQAERIRCQFSSPKVVIYFQLDDGGTTETCSYVYISNVLTYDSDVA
jgi:hypothetical protein